MSEGKHTPWKAGIPERTDTDWFVCSIRDARNGLIAVVHASTREDCQRDANLIAASVNQRPTLLEALKEMVVAARCDNYESQGEPAIAPVGECACDPCIAARKACAAIAQAEKGAA